MKRYAFKRNQFLTKADVMVMCELDYVKVYPFNQHGSNCEQMDNLSGKKFLHIHINDVFVH